MEYLKLSKKDYILSALLGSTISGWMATTFGWTFMEFLVLAAGLGFGIVMAIWEIEDYYRIILDKRRENRIIREEDDEQ